MAMEAVLDSNLKPPDKPARKQRPLGAAVELLLYFYRNFI